MKKRILIIIGVVVVLLFIVVVLGMYKFNYLASKPGYDVDGNQIPSVESTIDTQK